MRDREVAPRGTARRPSASRRTAPSDPEAGGVTLLTVGAVVVAIGLVLLGAAVTAVHLEHRRLVSLADSAALAAAQSFALADVDGDRGGTGTVPVSEDLVRTSVSRHLAEATRHGGVGAAVHLVEATADVDGSVVVTLGSSWSGVPGGFVGAATVHLEASATARTIMR